MTIRETPLLSVVILTMNEEATLPETLRSLAGLSAEVFVVDSGSVDRTVEIAVAAGATVASHPFENYASQRNWAQENLPLETEWILHLDAGERPTPDLVREIQATLNNPPAGVNGFLIRRRTIFWGRWIRHGAHYPVDHLRLFRRAAGRCEERLYDQHFLVEGAVRRMKHDFLDFVAADLTSWTMRHARWAQLEAAGNRLGNDAVAARLTRDTRERRRLYKRIYSGVPLFVRPFGYWFYRYFLRLGFLDGIEGLVFHFLQGLWFRFLIDAITYERRRVPAPPA